MTDCRTGSGKHEIKWIEIGMALDRKTLLKNISIIQAGYRCYLIILNVACVVQNNVRYACLIAAQFWPLVPNTDQ